MADVFLSSLLTVVNAGYLFLVFYQQRVHALEGTAVAAPAESPSSFTAAFSMLLMASAVGVLDSASQMAYGIFGSRSLDSGGRGGAQVAPERLAAPSKGGSWPKPTVFLVLFWANEFIWEAMLFSGTAIAWELPNVAGRARPVIPMRYMAWVSTMAYMYVAQAAALRMGAKDALAGAVCIIGCLSSVLPLELLASRSVPAFAALVAACMCAFAYSTFLLARGIGTEVRAAARRARRALHHLLRGLPHHFLARLRVRRRGRGLLPAARRRSLLVARV